MAKYKTPLRRRLLNNLNRQRNRLIKNNARLEDVDFLFTVNTNENLSKLSTEELQTVSDRLKGYGRKTVNKRGVVELESFTRNKKALEELMGRNSVINAEKISAKRQAQTKIIQFKNEEVKSFYRKRQYDGKRRYIEQVRRYDDKIANRLERMSLKKFEEMIDRAGGLLSFDRIFATSPKFLKSVGIKTNSDELDKQSEVIQNMLADIDRFSRLMQRGG